MNLEEKILQQYSRKKSGFGQLPYTPFPHYACCERERHYKKLLGSRFETLNECRVLEIGAGTGDNLLLLNCMGVLRHNIYAN